MNEWKDEEKTDSERQNGSYDTVSTTYARANDRQKSNGAYNRGMEKKAKKRIPSIRNLIFHELVKAHDKLRILAAQASCILAHHSSAQCWLSSAHPRKTRLATKNSVNICWFVSLFGFQSHMLVVCSIFLFISVL